MIIIEKKEMPKKKDEKKQEDTSGSILVNLPANAKLLVDGTATSQTSATRLFVTPALPEGEFTYTLTAEIMRDGQAVRQTQQVAVRSGAQTRVSFDFTPTAVP